MSVMFVIFWGSMWMSVIIISLLSLRSSIINQLSCSNSGEHRDSNKGDRLDVEGQEHGKNGRSAKYVTDSTTTMDVSGSS